MKPLFRCLAAALLWSAARAATPASPAGFDLQLFMQETQRMSKNADGVAMVWWLPPTYWEESLRGTPNLTPRQREEMTRALTPYNIFVVTKMDISPLAVMTGRPRSQLVDALDVKFNGRTLDPTQDRDLSPEMKNLLVVLKPLMANMLGQLGSGLEFVVFPNMRGGKTIIDPRGPGAMEARFFENTFRWRVPLGSLMPPRVDPKSGETFPGNYSFNPYTGEKLAPKP